MSYKDILAPVMNLDEDEAALVAAGEMARIGEGRAAALIVAVHLASTFADKQKSLSEVLADIAAGPNSDAARERRRIVEWLERAPHDFETRDLTVENALNEHAVLGHALIADLVVMARDEGHGRARRAMIEHVLFQAGRPMLLVPSKPVRERRWKRVLIGWNAKAQAMRAVTEAMPLLKQADEVIVATIDAKPSPAGHGQAPGHELALHLSRHGVTAHVRNLDGLGRSHAQALLDQAEADAVDVLVLGAYGHTRAQELLFGGVTRDLLAASPVPLFMAH